LSGSRFTALMTSSVVKGENAGNEASVRTRLNVGGGASHRGFRRCDAQCIYPDYCVLNSHDFTSVILSLFLYIIFAARMHCVRAAIAIATWLSVCLSR